MKSHYSLPVNTCQHPLDLMSDVIKALNDLARDNNLGLSFGSSPSTSHGADEDPPVHIVISEKEKAAVDDGGPAFPHSSQPLDAQGECLSPTPRTDTTIWREGGAGFEEPTQSTLGLCRKLERELAELRELFEFIKDSEARLRKENARLRGLLQAATT